MRAVVYDRYGDAGVLAVRELPPPLPPGPAEVHVRVVAAALNPKDVLVRKGKFRLFTRARFPKGVGYDLAGTVIGGAGFEPGTRVFGMINGWEGRTLADEVVCRVDEVATMPELSFEQAAAIPLAGLTALQALLHLGKVGPETSVCINGASGGVGVFAVQIAKALGATVTSVSSGRNLELCRSLGADETLDYAADDPFARPAAYNVVFDVFGNRTFAAAASSLKPTGAFISTVPSRRIFVDSMRTIVGRSRRARLVLVRSRAEDLETLRGWADEGRLAAVVDRVYDLEQTAEAQRYLETKRARGKVVIRIADMETGAG